MLDSLAKVRGSSFCLCRAEMPRHEKLVHERNLSVPTNQLELHNNAFILNEFKQIERILTYLCCHREHQSSILLSHIKSICHQPHL